MKVNSSTCLLSFQIGRPVEEPLTAAFRAGRSQKRVWLSCQNVFDRRHEAFQEQLNQAVIAPPLVGNRRSRPIGVISWARFTDHNRLKPVFQKYREGALGACLFLGESEVAVRCSHASGEISFYERHIRFDSVYHAHE